MISDAFDDTRQNIACAAARLIAESGYDYATAKKKAAREVTGRDKLPSDWLPANEEIEEELRIYQSLFQADTQPARLKALRTCALSLMQELSAFEPIVFGGLVNGTAGEHSDIHLLVFADNPKEIDYWLLNQNIAFNPAEVRPRPGERIEGVQFRWQQEWVELAVMYPHQRRGLLKKASDGYAFRTDTAGLTRLLEAPDDTTPSGNTDLS